MAEGQIAPCFACPSFLANTKHLQVMFACFFSICTSMLCTRGVNLLLQVRGVQEGLRGLACRVCHFYHLGHGDPEEHEVEKDGGSTLCQWCFFNIRRLKIHMEK